MKERLDKELNAIIPNGYAALYIIIRKLVQKSHEDGYIVTSRGSIGASFAATMSEITEINPLPPHYVCPNCKNSEFDIEKEYSAGVDLPDKNCVQCGKKYLKNGFNIPFEMLLGFEGEKEPDIALNFAEEYLPEAHKYMTELSGKDKLVQNVAPIHSPTNDGEISNFTVDIDLGSMSGKILRLNILGDDSLSLFKQLEDSTGKKYSEIPLDDKKTMSLFKSCEALNCDLTDIDCKVGTLSIPEFGTNLGRQILIDTKPETFAELVKIWGLLHSTGVWANNAQELLKNNITTLKEIISTRDDIMNYLISKGINSQKAYDIMESVRCGKGLTDGYVQDMKNCNVPDWYIESCQKIKYLFSKAHVTAYTMMSFRIAYYKLHYPEAFYATYLTNKVEDFDIAIIKEDKEETLAKIKELKNRNGEITKKEKDTIAILKVAYEMKKRSVKIEDIG